VTPILFVVLPLVVLLLVLIVLISNGEHYAPQAYYRRKRGGAPVAYGFESLGPRPRRSPPGYEDEAGLTDGIAEVPKDPTP
jgi:hypothetical protein